MYLIFTHKTPVQCRQLTPNDFDCCEKDFELIYFDEEKGCFEWWDSDFNEWKPFEYSVIGNLSNPINCDVETSREIAEEDAKYA